MPRLAKKVINPLPQQTLILDNGAFTLKAGFAHAQPEADKHCHVIPNCIAKARDQKVYIAGQLDECTDFAEMAFRRPIEKGYLVNWDSELDIWRHTFFDDGSRLHCDPHETNLILTEAPNCPQALQNNCDQMVFEEFEFASCYRCLGPSLNVYNDITSLTGDKPNEIKSTDGFADCLLVIDSGYSNTTVTPILNGKPIQSAIRRLDIGGKLLTNRLKELISLRYYSLMDDSHLVSEMKEDACFVSSDFQGDLKSLWRGRRKSVPKPFNDRNIIVDYVLPNYTPKSMRGHIRPHDPSIAAKKTRLGLSSGTGEDYLPLGIERFVVPELLFTPIHIGMREAGIPEMIIQSLSQIPEGLWPAMVANILVVGGNCKIPGFLERLKRELRPLVSSELNLRIRMSEDPITYTWLGGAHLGSKRDILKSLAVTREEYHEFGSGWTARKFASNGH